MNGAFITGVGTGVGKTWVARGLARALRRQGRRVAAIKPIETGVVAEPFDALALARAAATPELVHAPGLYRARGALAPYAATLSGEAPPLGLEALADVVRGLASRYDVAVVEGAGGLLVPIDVDVTVADLAVALPLPIILVARDELGVLSYTLTAVESARARNLSILAVVLVTGDPETSDDSEEPDDLELSDRTSPDAYGALGLPQLDADAPADTEISSYDEVDLDDRRERRRTKPGDTLLDADEDEDPDTVVAPPVPPVPAKPAKPTDDAPHGNRAILADRLDVPVYLFPNVADDDEVLADAAEACGLTDLLRPPTP